jgi:hypothetical protein
VNNKGAPIARKSGDPGQRRRHEADDLLQMLLLIDVHKIALPKFVAEDTDRIPSTVLLVDNAGAAESSAANATMPTELVKLVVTMNDMMSKFMTTMDEVVKRLQRIEEQSASVNSVALDAILQRLDGIDNKINSSSLVVGISSCAPSLNKPADDANPAAAADSGSSKSWADQAKDLAKSDPTMMFPSKKQNTSVKPTIRARGNAAVSTLKAVPRQLTCFVGRLDSDIDEEVLAVFLQGQGILDAQCRKLKAKDGRVFRTAAFRVSCSEQYRDIFYDESQWPIGAELRDWVFKSKNGEQ